MTHSVPFNSSNRGRGSLRFHRTSLVGRTGTLPRFVRLKDPDSVHTEGEGIIRQFLPLPG